MRMQWNERGPDDVGQRVFRVAAAMILLGGAIPPLVYWWAFGRAPTLMPQEAKERLREPAENAVLVDVRPADVFLAGHIDGAVNWPLQEILAATQRDELPAALRDKNLLLVCDVGVASRRAVGHLADLGVERACSVRGGIQEWIRSSVEELDAQQGSWRDRQARIFNATPPIGGRFDRWCVFPDRAEAFPFRQSPLAEQAVAVLAFFVIKPVYTLLALGIVIVLWKARDPDLAALRWGMLFFFLGENACAANYLTCRETSYLLEYLHSYGMALCFGLTAYALLDGFDRRILMLSDPQRRCAATSLCRACVKHADVPCGLKQTFYWVIPVLGLAALMVPLADWQDNSYTTLIFGGFYHYSHLRVYQQFENWCCPAAAILLFAVSLGVLMLKRDHAVAWAKLWFAAGLGPLGFAALRVLLGGAYDQNRVWYLFWEEATELLFILGVCFVLWTFRNGLFPKAIMGRE
jgi:rhodanese-related sulfurtransferase